MVLLAARGFANGLGLDIHIRTKPRYAYSYIEAAAIKIGEDVLEVGSWGEYWVNGVEAVKFPFAMGGKFPVQHKQINDKDHYFRIEISSSEAIIVKTHNDLVNVEVANTTIANFATSTGMLGNYRDGSLLARDGATIMDNHDLFGQEWQVSASDGNLFLTPSPYRQCVPPHSIEQGRRLGESAVSQEAAEKACAHLAGDEFDVCVFDVITMDDLEMADIHGGY